MRQIGYKPCRFPARHNFSGRIAPPPASNGGAAGGKSAGLSIWAAPFAGSLGTESWSGYPQATCLPIDHSAASSAEVITQPISDTLMDTLRP
jgi:hypothetical protein